MVYLTKGKQEVVRSCDIKKHCPAHHCMQCKNNPFGIDMERERKRKRERKKVNCTHTHTHTHESTYFMFVSMQLKSNWKVTEVFALRQTSLWKRNGHVISQDYKHQAKWYSTLASYSAWHFLPSKLPPFSFTLVISSYGELLLFHGWLHNCFLIQPGTSSQLNIAPTIVIIKNGGELTKCEYKLNNIHLILYL